LITEFSFPISFSIAFPTVHPVMKPAVDSMLAGASEPSPRFILQPLLPRTSVSHFKRKQMMRKFQHLLPPFLPVLCPWNAHTSITEIQSQAPDTSLISIVLADFSPVKSCFLNQNTGCILKLFLLHLFKIICFYPIAFKHSCNGW